MEIIGNKNFKLQTTEALIYLKSISPSGYDFVKSHIEKVVQNNYSFFLGYSDVTYFVNKKIYNNKVLFASYLLMEAYHDNLVIDSVADNKFNRFNCYDGIENLKLCMDFHFKVLVELGASKEEIDFVKEDYSKKFNNEHIINIVGPREFIDKVKSALLLMKERDYLSYKTVIQNIGQVVYLPIYSSTCFDRYQHVPTCFMNMHEYNASVENMCGALLHEACHGKLYKDALYEGKNPDKECSGYEAEMYCLTREITCLRNIGAPDELIQGYVSYYGFKWWEDDPRANKLLKH